MGADVIIVGAGPAGLSVAVALQQRGIQPLVLDRAGVAGSWRRRYRELRLNTTRTTSSVRGHPIPRGAGRWVTRDDYVRYLDQVAGTLHMPVRSGITVDRIEHTGAAWRIHTTAGALDADAVVIATGPEAQAVRPDWATPPFPVPVWHVDDLRDVQHLAGRRVIIVGAGNSGVDLAGHLVRATARVSVAMRTPPTLLPRQHRGIPLQAVAVATRWLPRAAKDVLATATARATLGDLTRYGLTRAALGPYTRFDRTGVTIAVDTGFVAALRSGHAQVIAAAVGWTDTGVRLADGSTAEADAVILATGYRGDLHAVVGGLGVLDPTGHPLPPLPGPARRRPGLYFAGYRTAVEGTLRRHDSDARAIAASIANSTGSGDLTPRS